MTEDRTTGGWPRRPPATPAHRARSGATQGGYRPPGAGPRAVLTAQDVRRLTLFKWRYSLESAGFSSRQAAHLLFLKWLYARRGSAREPVR